jgi:predicted membrane protein
MNDSRPLYTSPACDRGSAAPGFVIGFIVLAIGVFILLDNIGVLHVPHLWRFWPVIFVAVGLSKALDSRRGSAMLWGLIVASCGVLLLLGNFNYISLNFNVIWPLLLIGFGANMLWRTMERQKNPGGPAALSTPTLNQFAIFGGCKQRVDSREFRGGQLFAMFGGVEIDLRHSSMPAGEAVVDVNAMFGGVELRIPETWTVNLKGTGIFGGFDDKTTHPNPVDGAKPPELTVTGMAMFGGVSVQN